MRKRKPGPVTADQRQILDDLRMRRAFGPSTAAEPAEYWAGNALNRLKGRGFVEGSKRAWWLTSDGATA